MLTLKNWKKFWIYQFSGILVFFIPIIILTFIFSSSFSYLGESTSSLFSMILKFQPFLVFYSVIKILGVSSLICCGLHFISLSYKYKYKCVFGFLFFTCTILRVISLYPAISEKWFLINKFEITRKFVQNISMLPLDSKMRAIINWLPFLFCCLIFIVNFILFMKNLMKQGRIVQKARSSIYVDELDLASKIFSIQGLSFIVFIIFGSLFLVQLNSSLELKLPKNNTKQNRPNIFIFAADSLRYDRLNDKQFSHVMPFLMSKLKDATLFKPMAVGVPRTFPSWVEIAEGNYSSKTGVRTMFPSRSSRQGKKNTIFQLAKENGYSTVFVSDFAGDIFPRYPFGGEIVDAPSSNLKTLVENGIITILSPLQAVLLLPNLQRVLPSLLESPEIADPRLLANTIGKDLAQVANLPKPVFLTAFFSSAHFPYASPGPWYGKFQQNCNRDMSECDHAIDLLFEKIPDQVINRNESYKLNHPTQNEKDQTIALYNGSLNSIDFTLEKLFTELEKKGWLNNSIILIFGDHGENLYDGNMGMGHGDGVEGEFSNITPLIIYTQGSTVPAKNGISTQKFVRTIDIAPTIAKRLDMDFHFQEIDGVPLLDKVNTIPNFPTTNAYMETGIWFTSGKLTPENQARIIYPSVAALVDIDPFMNFEFYLRPSYYQAIPGVKERAWINNDYRLVVRTNKDGTQMFLYSRLDTNALHDLMLNTSYRPIAIKMLNELNNYLSLRGVEIIPSKNGSFFYAENITQ